MAAVATLEATHSGSHRMNTDAALAASGDRQAFERLYRAHVNRIYSLCARMVADRLRAEELTQDVFVRAWEKLHLFRGESSFGTWLHRMTVNVVLNARKSESRRQSRFEDSEDENGGVDTVASSSTSGTVGMPLPPGDLLDLEEVARRQRHADRSRGAARSYRIHAAVLVLRIFEARLPTAFALSRVQYHVHCHAVQPGPERAFA